MKSFFTADFFGGNRRRLREASKGAPVVIAANGLLQRGSIDSAYAFTQDANFWYLTGVDEPDLVLVIDGDEEYLIVPERSANREAFDGTVAHDTLTRRSGIKTVLGGKEGWERLGSRVKQSERIATLPPLPAYVEAYGVYSNPARANLVARLKSHQPDVQLVDLSRQLARMRMIKQPEELAAMRKAIEITIGALKDITRPQQLQSYAHEYELEADLSQGFRRRGAAGHSFEPIVAGGRRACTLHNVANTGSLKAGELVIIDCGAEVEHYAADITRTIIPNGEPSPRQQAVHAAVLDVQQFALSLLKPSITLKDYEKQVHEYMGRKLQELKLIKKATPAAIRKFYPHGTSHFIGLNVHDAGEYDKPLPVGAVVSCEPGIYIPEEGIGVRIEDDVLITKDGNEVLTARLSSRLT
jgi:Xaa-Pro aminopeptidase